MPSTVLVVEDDREIRELVRGYLERAGYAAHTTASGAEAIRLLGAGDIDLVVLDLGLPDVDGLAVAGLIGVAVWQANQPDDVAVPAAATDAGDGVVVGSGPVTVEVYLDFLCPACKQFHDAARPTLDGYLADGTITLVCRPIAILDRLTTTQFSTRAASAAGCASDDEIIQIAAGAGLPGSAFVQCVRDRTYRDWVVSNTDAASDRGVTGTPTVFVNGERLEPHSVEMLVVAVEAGAGG